MSLTNLLDFASVMSSIGGVALAIVILLAMVTIHEFGHYVAGKILGFRINEFSVGFGPALFKKRSKKTGELFALRIIPLGGYCAFDGEDEYDEKEPEEEVSKEEEEIETPFDELAENGGDRVKTNEEKTENASERSDGEYPQPKGERFNDQPPWKRIIVLVAGALMNYLLALTLILIMFGGIGRPVYCVVKEKPQESVESQAQISQTVDEDSGLQEGDIILKIDGKNVYLITDYIDILNGRRAGESVKILVENNGKEEERILRFETDINFASMSDTNSLLEAMDIYGLYTTTINDGFFTSIGHSFVYSLKIGSTVLRSLGELLTGKLGLTAMGGPVTTIKVTAQAASGGMLSFLNIAAFIGVNLAVFNLLPIPALDGCKVIFCIIEWIRKKPVNRKVETMIHFIGIIALFAFAILVDVLQLFV